jgi:thiol:disulfide interchange protein DsbD
MKILISLILLTIVFSSCQKAPVHEASSIWKPYSKEALLDSVAHHKPVVIDFSADWCPNCHDLDRLVFALPDVQAKLKQVTALKVDVTNQDDPEVQKIAQEYGLEGVPTVVFLDGKGKEIDNSRVIGFVSPKEFNESLALLKIFK